MNLMEKWLMVALDTWQLSASSSMPSAGCANAASGDDSAAAVAMVLAGLVGDFMTLETCCFACSVNNEWRKLFAGIHSTHIKKKTQQIFAKGFTLIYLVKTMLHNRLKSTNLAPTVAT